MDKQDTVNTRTVLGVILGGGRGTRLFPLTQQRAKPAVPLAGKYRLIDIPISNCINSEINRIFILTQFLSASLHRHVYKTYKFDIFSHGFVELLPAEQTMTSSDWYQGTADAVRRQAHAFSHREIKDVLILPGDHLYRMNFRNFIQFHRKMDADISISVSPVPMKDTSRFGIVQIDDRQWVTDYLEKPGPDAALKEYKTDLVPGKPYLASMGIYLMKIDALKRILLENSGTDFGKNIIPYAVHNAPVSAFPYFDYWEDIGTIGSFYHANLALTRYDAPFDFYDPHNPIYTHSRFLPPSWLENCKLDRAVICDGTRMIDADISECIMGLRSVVRPGAKIEKVIMMGADFYEDDPAKEARRESGRPLVGIGEDSDISCAIIDKNARIGRNVKIECGPDAPDSDHEHYFVRDGIVVIPKNAVIADGTIIRPSP